MGLQYNIYCDESCHLENDGSEVMLLGATWFPRQKKKEIFRRIGEIKKKHGFEPWFEIKWNKVSSGKIAFFKDIVDYFFDDDDLHFRALIVPNKRELDHKKFDQTYDVFYYKMYFYLLNQILAPGSDYRIYIDIKDTKSLDRVNKLHEVLSNNRYDFKKQMIQRVQQVRSHEVQVLQITDLLTGALSYVHRNLETSSSKLELIERIRQRSNYSLQNSTLPKEPKFNIFVWQSTKVI
jgi:hypothetical protein